jgi:UDP-glucose 4-epimerase
MKILVTGGAGFIASHVVDLLVESGHDVVVVDNLSTGRKSNLNPQAKFYQVDIRNLEEMEKIFASERPEVIDHHAAQMDVRRSVLDPVYDADINVLGALNLLNLSVKYGVRKFIHISSGGAVYGEPVYVPCDEKHPVQPLCPYGATKYILELYLYMFKANFGLDYTILRYGNVYGPRQDPAGEAGVVAIFTGNMLAGKPVTIFGAGEQVRDYVFVKDCARANLLAVDKGSGEVINLGYGVPTTVNQIFSGLKEITCYPMDANYAPARTGETFRIYLAVDKAREQLGWTAQVSLMEGLQKTVEYFQEKGKDA